MKNSVDLAVLVLLLAGCSASAPETAPSTPSAESGASVERWAGLVAERQADTDEWFEDWDGANCSALSPVLTCNIILTSASFIAETSHIVIAGPSDPTANTYLGDVPDEIADLYAETILKTETARDAAVTWREAGCGTTSDGECGALAFQLTSAMDAVRTKFAAWSPYL